MPDSIQSQVQARKQAEHGVGCQRRDDHQPLSPQSECRVLRLSKRQRNKHAEGDLGLDIGRWELRVHHQHAFQAVYPWVELPKVGVDVEDAVHRPRPGQQHAGSLIPGSKDFESPLQADASRDWIVRGPAGPQPVQQPRVLLNLFRRNMGHPVAQGGVPALRHQARCLIQHKLAQTAPRLRVDQHLRGFIGQTPRLQCVGRAVATLAHFIGRQVACRAVQKEVAEQRVKAIGRRAFGTHRGEQALLRHRAQLGLDRCRAGQLVHRICGYAWQHGQREQLRLKRLGELAKHLFAEIVEQHVRRLFARDAQSGWCLGPQQQAQAGRPTPAAIQPLRSGARIQHHAVNAGNANHLFGGQLQLLPRQRTHRTLGHRARQCRRRVAAAEHRDVRIRRRLFYCRAHEVVQRAMQRCFVVVVQHQHQAGCQGEQLAEEPAREGRQAECRIGCVRGQAFGGMAAQRSLRSRSQGAEKRRGVGIVGVDLVPQAAHCAITDKAGEQRRLARPRGP